MPDGIEVGRIGREKQQDRARWCDELPGFGRGMKRGLVHDHEVVGI